MERLPKVTQPARRRIRSLAQAVVSGAYFPNLSTKPCCFSRICCFSYTINGKSWSPERAEAELPNVPYYALPLQQVLFGTRRAPGAAAHLGPWTETCPQALSASTTFWVIKLFCKCKRLIHHKTMTMRYTDIQGLSSTLLAHSTPRPASWPRFWAPHVLVASQLASGLLAFHEALSPARCCQANLP